MLHLTRQGIVWFSLALRCPPLSDRGSARWVHESPERVHRLSPICTPFEDTSLNRLSWVISIAHLRHDDLESWERLPQGQKLVQH